jgi:hypothetical protein
MRYPHHRLRRNIAVALTCGVLLSSVATGMAISPPGQTATAQSALTESVDGGWPRTYTAASGANLVLYQPQVASWDNQTVMTLYAAVAYTPVGGKRELGTIKTVADTKVSVDERLVDYSSLRITEATFPTLDKPQVQEIVQEITNAVKKDGVIALDRVLAGMDSSQIIAKNADGIKADPPKIYFSKTPAVLVNLDGEPVWGPIMGTDLSYAINTNWDLFEHTPTKTFYLRDDEVWLKSTTLEGGWGPAGKLPESFNKLPQDDNWKDVKAALPGKKVSPEQAPRVFVTLTPAEMILLKGEPTYAVITNTNLFWISNTESDVFRVGKTGLIYYLVAGRWFSAKDFTGSEWTFASLNLPEDFKKIPVEHPRSRVLASVPGTDQAAQAVLVAQIPETARVNKKGVNAPEVQYQGEPQFEPIAMTTVQRAVNTDKQIIKVGDNYYMCFQGVWFVSKTPTGPWEVTGTVPKEIYEIPPSSPASPVTHVTVVEDNDDAVVFAAAAAYTGVMIAWGCAVWGSGYYYPPYVWYGGGYPVYYPRYPTYGYSAWYNPWTGAYGRGVTAYGPYGGAGVGARYNPSTGTYARGAAAYGPYGARGAASAYNPNTGAFAQTRQGSNVYGSWGSTAVTRGDQWATTSRVTNNVTGATTRVTQGSQGNTAISRTGAQGGRVVGTSQGDLYAGRDGNVYRRDSGTWQKYDSGSWNNLPPPTAEQRQQAQERASQAGAQARERANSAGYDSNTVNQLNRDRSARTEGTQRTSDYGSVRSGSSGGSSVGSSGSRSSGSYRPRGGGRRR